MKVKELIKELQKFDGELECTIAGWFDGEIYAPEWSSCWWDAEELTLEANRVIINGYE